MSSAHNHKLADRTHATEEDMLPDQLEHVRPPEWRAVLSLDTDLGYPDFYPSHPGSLQPIHVLDPNNIKFGYASSTVSSVNQNSESFSIHHIINEKIKTRDVLDRATDFARLVLEAKARRVGRGGPEQRSGGDEGGSKIPSHDVKGPSRAILNPLMRSLFLQDLANPRIPLSQVAKIRSLPSGLKGVEMLEVLWEKGVDIAISDSARLIGQAQMCLGEGTPTAAVWKGKGRMLDRAAWLIHVVGGHEVQALRNKMSSASYQNPFPHLAPSQIYSIDFTAMYLSWLGRQLAELTLPVSSASSASLPGDAKCRSHTSSLASPHGVGSQEAVRSSSSVGNMRRNVFGQTDGARRDAWSRKWDYSTALLRTLLDRPRLIHQATMWFHLAHLLEHANLLQVGLVAALIDEFASDFTLGGATDAMVIPRRRIVGQMVRKLSEVRSFPLRAQLSGVERTLASLIKEAWVIMDESTFSSPFMWRSDGEFLTSSDSPLGLKEPLDRHRLGMLRRSAERLLMRDAAHRIRALDASGGRDGRHLAALHGIADQYSMPTEERLDVAFQRYFDVKAKATAGSAQIASRSHDLLDWATIEPMESVPHRIRVAGSLLQKLDEECERGTFIGLKADQAIVEDIIVDWLLKQGQSTHQQNFVSVGLMGEAVQARKLLRYLTYINRLIALGLTAGQQESVVTSTAHLNILRAMPIIGGDPKMHHQREVALNGFPLTDKPGMCDSPTDMTSQDSGLDALESLSADPEILRAVTRRLSTVPHEPSHLKGQISRSLGDRLFCQDGQAVWELCHAGFVQLGDTLTEYLAPDSTCSIEACVDKARVVLNLFAAAGGQARAPADPRCRTLEPIHRIIRLLTDLLDTGTATRSDKRRLAGLVFDIYQSVLLILDSLWLGFWSTVDSATANLFLGCLVKALGVLSEVGSSRTANAWLVLAAYLEAAGKDHPCLIHNVQIDTREVCANGRLASMRTPQSVLGPPPVPISWSAGALPVQIVTPMSMLLDRAWEQPPVSPAALASVLSYRDNAVEFSKPTNAGAISLALFRAVYTGDRIEMAANSHSQKLRSEMSLTGGMSGGSILRRGGESAATGSATAHALGTHLLRSLSPDIIEILSDGDDARPENPRTAGKRLVDEVAPGSALPPVAKKQRTASLSQRGKVGSAKLAGAVAGMTLAKVAAKKPAPKRKSVK